MEPAKATKTAPNSPHPWFRWQRGVAILVLMLPVFLFFVRNNMPGVPAHIGVHDHRLAACPASPNCVCSHDQDNSHFVAPLPLLSSPEEEINQLVSIVQQLPRTQIVRQEANYLHVEFRSWLFRFVDDVEFLISEEEDVIHVRSASRVGHSDLGVNRKRIEQIRSMLVERHQSPSI